MQEEWHRREEEQEEEARLEGQIESIDEFLIQLNDLLKNQRQVIKDVIPE